MSNYSPRYIIMLRSILKRRHGLTFERLYSLQPETRIIMYKLAREEFHQRMIEKWGSLTNYRNHLAQQRGFKNEYQGFKATLEDMGMSVYQYRTEIAKKNGFDSVHQEQASRLEKRGFERNIEYHNHLARERGFKDKLDYDNWMACESGYNSKQHRIRESLKKRGFASETEYKNYLARRKGFKNHYERYHHQHRREHNDDIVTN